MRVSAIDTGGQERTPTSEIGASEFAEILRVSRTGWGWGPSVVNFKPIN